MSLILAALLAVQLPALAQVRPLAPNRHPIQFRGPNNTTTPTPTASTESDDDDNDDEDDAATPPPVNEVPQNPGNSLAVATPPVNRPPAQAVPPPGAPGGAPATNLVRVQFPNSDVDDVLRFYEQLTGLKLVRDNFVQGKVSIFLTKDVPREEAIKIIEINLLMNGFSLVPAGDGIVKVIGTGKNPRTSGVPIVSDESQIPEGDHVISYVFKLRYADAQELQTVLQQYLSPPQPYTAVQALPKSSTVLVTENSSVIRMLVKIIDQIDNPPAEVVSEFVKLERADASKVVDMLKDIFEKGQGQPGTTTGATAGGVRGVRTPNMPMPPQPVANVEDIGGLMALSEESIVVGKIKLTPDVRTNRIHVVTRPVNMPFVRKLIAEFDANVEFAKPVTRPLNYISAGDVLPVLVQALTEPGTQQQGGADQTGANAGNQRQQNQQGRTGASTNSSTSNTTAGSLSGTASDSSLNVSEELSTNPVDTTPKAVTVGNAKLVADQRANSIIMLGNREVVVKVQKILDEMDVPAPQVALSTVIGELTLGKDDEFGVDYFAKYKGKLVGISRNTTAPIPNSAASPSASPVSTPVVTSGVIDPAGLINFGSALQQVAAGTNVYVAAGNYLATIVHALESTNNFRVISRPTVFTSNNKKAIIASGTEIPVPVSTLSSVVAANGVGSNIGQQSNIEFKKVALQLEVVPLINSQKDVSLDILQKIDSLAGSQNIDGNSIPTIATRYIRSNVTAPNGSTIILGGLIQDSKQKTINGIQYLDRIPLLGQIFRSTVTNRTRMELIIMMCPQVSVTQVDLHQLRMKEEGRTHFGPELDQNNCPDCPPQAGEEKQLPAPDLPPEKSLK